MGAPLEFAFRHGEGDGLSEEELRGEVLRLEPERLLEFRWGKHVLRCELVAEEGGCVLHFSETLDDPSWAARNAAGWEMCLEAMETLLQVGTLAKFGWEVWRAKFKRYVAKFEPSYGPQQGPPDNHPATEAGS